MQEVKFSQLQQKHASDLEERDELISVLESKLAGGTAAGRNSIRPQEAEMFYMKSELVHEEDLIKSLQSQEEEQTKALEDASIKILEETELASQQQLKSTEASDNAEIHRLQGL